MYSDAQLKAIAHMVAEHEVMRDRLMELEELCVGLPLRWRGSGEPLVDLAETIKKFIEDQNAGITNLPDPNFPEPPDCFDAY